MVYCVYSLESPPWGDSNKNTQYTFKLNKNKKDIPIMLPDLALWITLISSNYPFLEHVFMIQKVFEPLKDLLCMFTHNTHIMCCKGDGVISDSVLLPFLFWNAELD